MQAKPWSLFAASVCISSLRDWCASGAAEFWATTAESSQAGAGTAVPEQTRVQRSTVGVK